MAVTREQVFRALFAKLQHVSGIKETSRRFTLPGVLEDKRLPILMLWEQPEVTEYTGKGLRRRKWNAWIVVYFKNPDFTKAGATIINPILESIEDALKLDNFATSELTLDGLVYQCRIVGEIYKETGDTNTEGLGGIVVPIEILVP